MWHWDYFNDNWETKPFGAAVTNVTLILFNLFCFLPRSAGSVCVFPALNMSDEVWELLNVDDNVIIIAAELLSWLYLEIGICDCCLKLWTSFYLFHITLWPIYIKVGDSVYIHTIHRGQPAVLVCISSRIILKETYILLSDVADWNDRMHKNVYLQ